MMRKTGFQIIVLLILVFSHQMALADGQHDKAGQVEGQLLMISPSDYNFLFKSVVDKLIHQVGYDYVPLNRPANRAIQEVLEHQLDMAGPFPKSMFDFTFNDAPIVHIQNGTGLVAWEPIHIYPLKLNTSFSFTPLKDLKDLRIGYLFNHFRLKNFDRHQTLRTKTMDQLVNLLQVGRIDLALVSYQVAQDAIQTYAEIPLDMGQFALYSEMQYLHVSPKHLHFIDDLSAALKDMRQTDFYKIRKKLYGEGRAKDQS